MALGIDFARFAASPALVAAKPKQIWTYGDIAAGIQWFSRLFGSAEKSLIFCFCRDDATSIIAYIASLESRQAIAMVDGSLNCSLKLDLVRRYRPDWIFRPADGSVEEMSVFPEYDCIGTSPSGIQAFRSCNDRALPPLHPSLALLLPTSGTTGSPKLVRLSADNVRANALSIQTYLGIDSCERPAFYLPIHYSYGLSVINSHLLAGARILLPGDSIIRSGSWEFCRAENCTSFAGVPYTYEILDRINFNARIPANLKTMTQAGGKLDNRLIMRFDAFMKNRGGRFLVMYGQTEATARMSYLPSDRLPDKLGSVGVPIPGGKFWIEKDGRAVEPMEIGEVVYSGPNVMLGYAEQREDLSRGDELMNVLHTGDLGYLDPDGFLFITGRNKRTVKLYGHRINLDEVEKAIQERSSALGPIAVVGATDSLIVYCERGETSDFERLRMGLSELYRLNANGFQFKTINKLPLTSSGKVDYKVLQSV